MTLLEARDLSLGYDGHSVVEHVSFQVDEGDYLCIIGDNGAGKSTLVKAVLSLNPPLSGQLTFNVDRRGIGYLPQSAMLDPGFPTSVEEVALSGAVSRLGRRFFYPKAERERALGNLERMGMLAFAHRPFQELSGGQRQRVLLARALTAASRILLLDEPVAGLDMHTSSELYRLIDALREDGMTIMMVTHDIHPALNDARTILHLSHGRYFFGPKEAYFASDMGKEFLKEAGHDK